VKSARDGIGENILPNCASGQHHSFVRVWTSKAILPSVLQAVRTAIAATLSVLVAWLVRMPEPYWSAIATLVVMQSTLRATLTLSLARIVASALGASVGAIEAIYFGQNLVAFGLTVFLLGLMSFASRLDKPGYRYASATLAIVVLIPRAERP
jgi:uncharacterized membrane protein YgaE (UPF0421/DUF939 family)